MTNTELLQKTANFLKNHLSGLELSDIKTFENSVERPFKFTNAYGEVRRGKIKAGKDIAADRYRQIWVHIDSFSGIRRSTVTMRQRVKDNTVNFGVPSVERLNTIIERAEQSLLNFADSKQSDSSRFSENYSIRHQLRLRGCDIRNEAETIVTPIAVAKISCIEKAKVRNGGDFNFSVNTNDVELLIALKELVSNFEKN